MRVFIKIQLNNWEAALKLSKMFATLYFLVAVFALTVSTGHAADQGAYEVEPRPGVKMDVFYAEPDNPSAIIIFWEGGGGLVDVSTNEGTGLGKRTLKMFLDRGIAVALPDAPPDQRTWRVPGGRGPLGMHPRYRMSKEHLADVGSVVSWLKKTKLPVWLVGPSAGPLSVANYAAEGDLKVDGVVIMSPLTTPGLLAQPLDKITSPALVIAHEDDACPNTPVSGSKKVHQGLTNSSNAQFKLITGGDSGPGGACMKRSHHDFWENEEELVSVIVDFIKTNKK